MNPFINYLQELNQRIQLPQPQKSRIILEISADLTDLYKYYLQQGMNEEQAKQSALDRMAVSDEEVTELVQIHDHWINRLMNKLSNQGRNRWEKILLLFLIAFTVIFSGNVIFNHEFFRHSSVFITPVLILAISLIIHVITRVYKLFIKRDHTISRLRKGIPAVLFFGGAALLAGILGFFIDTYLTVSRIAADMEKTLIYFIDWMLRISSLAVFTLFVVIFAAMAPWAFWP